MTDGAALGLLAAKIAAGEHGPDAILVGGATLGAILGAAATEYLRAVYSKSTADD